ncbi:MAG: cell division topological specificity factor MinE [Chloroflexota bacterium]|nr:cell division topological specificity factor MinE [Chloroflexota bacterium]MDE2950616.1 cell division topological specificity factor MinE [Chloroflexota bacterium]
MTSLLNRLFGRPRKGSGKTAKDRLRFVLQHDRINLPPERLEEMKREILAVIVKYVVVDKDRVEIALEQRDRNQSKLVAEIPVVKQTVPPSPETYADSRQNNSDKPLGETEDSVDEGESAAGDAEEAAVASEDGEGADKEEKENKK